MLWGEEEEALCLKKRQSKILRGHHIAVTVVGGLILFLIIY
jgi:hypothetical protein